MSLLGGLVAGGLGLVGGILGGKSAERAAETGAAGSVEAARIGAQAGAFRPVGISSRFGTSRFVTETDPATGLPIVKEAGYDVAPDVASLREGLFRRLGPDVSALDQLQSRYLMPEQSAGRMTALGSQLLPSSTARRIDPAARMQAERLYDISQDLRPTTLDPNAAARNYFEEQVGLLSPQRARDLQALERSTFARGRTGLSVGDIGSPELYSLTRAQEEQNAALAFQSRERARNEMLSNLGLSTQYGLQGLQTQQSAEALARQRFAEDVAQSQGLFTGADALYGLSPAAEIRALGPVQTQLNLVTALEELGQRPLGLSAELAGRQSSAGQAGGQLIAQAGQNAANLRAQAGMVAPTIFAGGLNSVLSNPYAMQGFSNMSNPFNVGGMFSPYQVSTQGPSGLSYQQSLNNQWNPAWGSV